MKRARIVVDGEFKKLLKMRSAEEDITVLELTRRMAEEQKYPEFAPSRNKRRRSFDWEI